MDLNIKLLFSVLAIALTFIGFIPYIRSIVLGRTHAHVFSWVIWGTTTMVVFFAQLVAEAGVGAIPIGVSGVLTILVAILAYLKRAKIQINLSDWFFFITAIASLPIWYFTSAMWAVVVLTLVDLLGFGPTIRKAYKEPFKENTAFFFMFLLRNTCAILALESYSITTVLFPFTIVCACSSLIVIIHYRRKTLSRVI